MADEKNTEGGFPQTTTQGTDAYSTTGDGHPPRPNEMGNEEDVAGQGLGQQKNTGTSAGAGSSSSGNM